MIPRGVVTITDRSTKLKRSYQKRAARRSMVTTVGFIRVRRRKLKPKYRWHTPSRGRYAGISRKVEIPDSSIESVSYDLVRAGRIGGEPRHKFVLGFGSPASVTKYVGDRRGVTLFWMHSFDRMEEHGFSKEQRFHIAEMLTCKGIPVPTVKECRKEKAKHIAWRAANPGWGTDREAQYDEVIAFVRHSNRPRSRKGGGR